MPFTPHLAAEYTGLNGEPIRPAIEAVKRMLPPPRLRSSGMALPVVQNTERTLRSMAIS